MLGNVIANRLRQVLSNFTNDFTDVINITQLTKNNNLITADATSHGLTTGDYIAIKGAKRRINIESIVVNNGVATITLAENSNLFIEVNSTVEILGCSITGYNGIKTIIEYPTFKSISFNSNNLGNANDGYILVNDNIFFNGYKQITKINDNQFSYPVENTIANGDAYGDIKLNKFARIQHAGSSERANEYYKNDATNKWLFVILGDERVEENGAGITTQSYSTNNQFYFRTILEFSLFVAIPTQNSKLASAEADLARSYVKPILKSLANYRFDSNLTQQKYQPCLYLGNGSDTYNVATYIHRFDFAITGEIIDNDGVDHFEEAVPLLSVNLDNNNWQSNINY